MTTFISINLLAGIGKVIALEIAKRGGAVHLVCRNEERGKAAVEDIKTGSNNEVSSTCLRM